MSTCPEKDIHSVYLDNELPLVYLKEYESHVNQCPKCQAELAKLRSIRSMIKADSASIELSQKELDDSFLRLQARMSYAKVTNNATVHQFFIPKWAIGAVAAAVAFALVLPVTTKTLANKEQEGDSSSEVATIIDTSNMPQIPRAAIPSTHLTSLISSQNQNTISHPASFAVKSQEESLQTIQESLTSVDVFRPDFPDKALSIKITLSPFSAMNETNMDIQNKMNIPVVIETQYGEDSQGFEN